MKNIIRKILLESEDNLNSNFYKWFGNSKVSNNGKPLIVYHGSRSDFETFYKYSFFTDDFYNADGYAGGEYIYEVYLSIQNPFIVNAKERKWDNLENDYGSTTVEIVSNVNSSKYDGVIFYNIKDSWIDDVDYQDASTVYVPFKPNQIKSIYNKGTWNKNNNNIFL